MSSDVRERATTNTSVSPMSMPTAAPLEDGMADPWRQWQLANAKSSRRAAAQARVGFALILTSAAAWLAFQLLSSPAWR